MAPLPDPTLCSFQSFIHSHVVVEDSLTSQSDTASRKQSLERPGPRRESTHEGSLLLVPLSLGALMLALVLGAGVPPRH